MKAAGFVLTGGQSSRMGRDKAHLLLGSRYLVEEIAETVLQVVDSVILIGRPETFADLQLKCLPDLRSGGGPLAGLETALAGSPDDDALNLVVGCDMPGLQACWLEQLLETAQETGALCATAKDAAGKIHPLCAVYRTACLPFVRKALDTGRLRLTDLLASVASVEVPVEDVIANVNTPAEWAAWQGR
jgi:molybdopterin-guanine dinucleotide biosynthesis protein A